MRPKDKITRFIQKRGSAGSAEISKYLDIFRVFADDHPGVTVGVTNASRNVAAMNRHDRVDNMPKRGSGKYRAERTQ